MAIKSQETSKGSFDFLCPNPDFIIRLLPDEVEFQVRKSKLAGGSGVFRDMFGVCDDPASNASPDGVIPKGQTMDMHENPHIFGLLLALVHGEGQDDFQAFKRDPATGQLPKGNLRIESFQDTEPQPVDEDDLSPLPASTPVDGDGDCEVPQLPDLIPLPVLRPLLDMADKYMITPPYQRVLKSHLMRYAPSNALEVYCLCNQLDFTIGASYASSFLLDQPLDKYTHEEVARYFPSMKAYHRITLLHGYRKRKLRKLLMGEELFPHGYGRCPKHAEEAERLWYSHRKEICYSIAAGTDVMAEMTRLNTKGVFAKCHPCGRACKTAIKMLEYKLGKIPYSFDQVPGAL